MFTGLVADVGLVVSQATTRLCIETTLGPLTIGESIAVEGCCLTVVAVEGARFFVDASVETLRVTTIGELAPGSRVNLERALLVGDRLGGHLVSGHVDGVGALAAREPAGESVKMSFSVPRELARYIAQKGSITVSGVSLTVNEALADRFEVMIIPHTARHTTLGALAPGDRVNLEVDLVARYLERLLQARTV